MENINVVLKTVSEAFKKFIETSFSVGGLYTVEIQPNDVGFFDHNEVDYMVTVTKCVIEGVEKILIVQHYTPQTTFGNLDKLEGSTIEPIDETESKWKVTNRYLVLNIDESRPLEKIDFQEIAIKVFNNTTILPLQLEMDTGVTTTEVFSDDRDIDLLNGRINLYYRTAEKEIEVEEPKKPKLSTLEISTKHFDGVKS